MLIQLNKLICKREQTDVGRRTLNHLYSRE